MLTFFLPPSSQNRDKRQREREREREVDFASGVEFFEFFFLFASIEGKGRSGSVRWGGGRAHGPTCKK